MSKVLTARFHSTLTEYKEARRNNRLPHELLVRLTKELEAQTPSHIAQSEGLIANTAELFYWEPKPSLIARIFKSRISDRTLLAENEELKSLFIFHKNGFLREVALDQISGPISSPYLVAALAWRLNDWVAEVRESATRCAERCLPKTDGQVIANFFLDTVHQHKSWRRWTEKQTAVLEAQLQREDVIQCIVHGLNNRTTGALPSSLAHFLKYAWIDPYLESIAQVAKVPGVRAIALSSLISAHAKFRDGYRLRWIDKPLGLSRREPNIIKRPLTTKSNWESSIVRGVTDGSSIVRRAAIQGIIDRGLDNRELVNLTENLVDDRSAAVRSRVSFILKKSKQLS
jgi:hypothetical protein